MRIGFYKPHFTTYFNDDTNDLNATSYEVANVFNIFQKFGHSCHMLSNFPVEDFDLGLTSYNHILTQKDGYKLIDRRFDRIFLYGGPYHLSNIIEDVVVDNLRQLTNRLDFILTDIRCMLSPRNMEIIDTFYSQSTNKSLFGYRNVYGAVAEFRCFDMKLVKPSLEEIKNKGIRLYFGGTSRNRVQKYMDYIWNNRKDWVITGYSKEIGFNNRVDRKVFLHLLKQTRFSLVFCDVDYEENNFITPRHYELIENNIISLVDKDWDKGEHILPTYSTLRVSNYDEFIKRVKYFEDSEDCWLEHLYNQQLLIKPEFIDGSYVYNILNEGLA